MGQDDAHTVIVCLFHILKEFSVSVGMVDFVRFIVWLSINLSLLVFLVVGGWVSGGIVPLCQRVGKTSIFYFCSVFGMSHSIRIDQLDYTG